jgi:hypothetical protein
VLDSSTLASAVKERSRERGGRGVFKLDKAVAFAAPKTWPAPAGSSSRRL